MGFFHPKLLNNFPNMYIEFLMWISIQGTPNLGKGFGMHPITIAFQFFLIAYCKNRHNWNIELM